MEGPKIHQIWDLPDSENLDLMNKGGFLERGGVLVKYRTDTMSCRQDSANADLGVGLWVTSRFLFVQMQASLPGCSAGRF